MEREKQKQSKPPAGFDEFGGGGDTMVMVAHGPYAEQLPVGGEKVGVIRAKYADRFDIDPLSKGYINGKEVGDDHRISAGEKLIFAKRAGEKGGRYA